MVSQLQCGLVQWLGIWPKDITMKPRELTLLTHNAVPLEDLQELLERQYQTGRSDVGTDAFKLYGFPKYQGELP